MLAQDTWLKVLPMIIFPVVIGLWAWLFQQTMIDQHEAVDEAQEAIIESVNDTYRRAKRRGSLEYLVLYKCCR